MLVVDTSGSMTACTTPPTSYPTEYNANAPGYSSEVCEAMRSSVGDNPIELVLQIVSPWPGHDDDGKKSIAHAANVV